MSNYADDDALIPKGTRVLTRPGLTLIPAASVAQPTRAPTNQSPPSSSPTAPKVNPTQPQAAAGDNGDALVPPGTHPQSRPGIILIPAAPVSRTSGATGGVVAGGTATPGSSGPTPGTTTPTTPPGTVHPVQPSSPRGTEAVAPGRGVDPTHHHQWTSLSTSSDNGRLIQHLTVLTLFTNQESIALLNPTLEVRLQKKIVSQIESQVKNVLLGDLTDFALPLSLLSTLLSVETSGRLKAVKSQAAPFVHAGGQLAITTRIDVAVVPGIGMELQQVFVDVAPYRP